jgi:RHS repeat-associated protein
LGVFTYNPRLPGQVYDPETGLHQNWNRDYQPSTGRYIQSDPMGLAGGINTYLYVNGQPNMLTDPRGQNPALAGLCFIPGIGWVGCGAVAAGVVIVGGVIAMSTPTGRKRIKDIADKIKDLCTPNDKDPCEQQQDDDEEDCRRDYGSVFGWGSFAYQGCMQRARINADLCRREQPPLPKWNDSDVNGQPPAPKPPRSTK